MRPERILLADDHPLTLAGIRAVLEQHFHIAGTATDGRAVVQEALRLKPDLVALDIGMPLLNGIAAAKQIRKGLPATRILFVTMHLGPGYLAAALEAGASGYVLKSAAGSELVEAVSCVLAGGTYVTPAMKVANTEIDRSDVGTSPTVSLTPRERQVLQLISQGHAAKQIAHAMGISAKTVAFHRENLKAKLGVRTIAGMTRYAIQQGFL